MNRQLYLVLLLAIGVFSVKFDTNDNDDLNERRSQRATQPMPMYSSDDGLNDDTDEKGDDGDKIQVEEQQHMTFYTPPFIMPLADEEQDEKLDMIETNEHKENSSSMNINIDENNQNDNEENTQLAEVDHDVENKEDVVDNAIQLQLPIIFPQLQSDEEPITNIPSSSSVNASDTDGVVIVQSHVPPKISSQTHAVFELVPVNNLHDQKYVENHEEDSNPLGEQQVIKKPTKTLKDNKSKRKPFWKPKRENNYNSNNNKSDLTNGYKKQRNNKRRPDHNSFQRPFNTHRHGSQNSRITIIRPHNNKRNQNKNKRVNFNNKQKFIVQKNKNKGNSQGSDTIITGTVTIPQAEADENYINYIIIRQDPPATAKPSFWNIFRGGNKNGSPRADIRKQKQINSGLAA